MAVDVNSLRHAQERGLTVGVIHTNGALRMRLEIDEFIKDKDMANLYILTLTNLQKMDSWRDPFSYFQIAGIHGKPFVPWDHVRPDRTTIIRDDLEKGFEGSPRHQPNPASGYCSHSSNLFPTWHRAYLAMLEQTIYLKMFEIAEQYPEPHRRRYTDAAARFGLPYWDPTLPRRRVTNRYGYPIFKCGVPIIMMILRVMVRTPDHPNELIPVENPLYGYEFHLDRARWDADVGFTWENMFRDVFQAPSMTLHTIRGLSPAGTMDHQYVNNTITNAASQTNGPAVPLGGKLYRLLNGPQMSYTQMANSAFIQHWADGKELPLNKENSLEGFHNDIHVMTGTGEGNKHGHMALNEFAAFDPIFWLHHANIDRLFAIWEALNPSDELWRWQQPLLQDASYITPVGTNETPESPLVPFRKHRHPDGTPIWWTSKEVRYCRSLGYTYPELAKTNSDVLLLRQWVIDNYEWATISGDPPPLETMFNTEDLERVELFPERLQIDGRGPPIDIPKERFVYGRDIAKSVGAIPRILAKCFVRSESSSAAEKRYKHLKGLIKNGKLTHWNVTIKVKKFALNGSFQILVFLGPFSPDPCTWHHDARLIGIDGIFASRSLDNCANCRQQHDSGLVDSDVVPLTTPLVAYWRSQEDVGGLRLKSLEAVEVREFLRRNLHWRVLDPNGRVHDVREIPSLSVTVGSQVVSLPYEFGALPRYEEEIPHFDITDGR